MKITGQRDAENHWRKADEFGEVYSAQLDEKKVSVNMQVRSDWERMLASLYFGNAILVIDCDPDDLSYGLFD
ncbi:hypothetical protein D3C79_1014820 [compost metagenome]